VELSKNAISEVTRLLEGDSGVHLAMPRREIHTPRSRLSRSYLRVWRELPRLRGAHVGSGFYAVSPAGRRRWGAFPSIISDDDFVKLQFAPEESAIAENAFFITRAPEGLFELIRVRARWCRGTEELRSRYPSLRVRSEASRRGALLNLLRSPGTWPHIPLFALVVLLAKWSAHRHQGTGLERWERAERARRVVD
jgi:hypothetical protein